MLREIRIADFAIINEALLEFGPGLTVLSGETGAGKSILVESMSMVLGGRPGDEMIRSNARNAVVEARFDLEGSMTDALTQWLDTWGFDCDGEVIIRRIVSKSGKNKAFINGAMATVAQVRQVGAMLVDIHGQNGSQALLTPSEHLFMLDRFAGLDEQRESYNATYKKLGQARRKLDTLITGQKEMERKIDLLGHQVNEISEANLAPGEDELLLRDRTLLVNAEKLIESTAIAIDELDEDEAGAVNRLGKAMTALDKIAGLDTAISGVRENMAESMARLEDTVNSLRDYMENIERDTNRLEQVDERLELIKNLKRKYGDTIDDILAFREQAEKELETTEFDRDNLDTLKAEVEQLEREALDLGLALDRKRRKSAIPFSKAVQRQLAELGMDKAVVKPEFVYGDGEKNPGPDGLGKMEFLFSANPGEPPKPLARIASGGEMSRLMLALKTVIAEARPDPVPVMIFDEIDAGVGGATADMLGKKLRTLARTGQVFCVTHLAQVARNAHQHFKVAKSVRAGKTTVSIKPLDKDGRVDELARMAGGATATKSAKRWAEEALSEAQQG